MELAIEHINPVVAAVSGVQDILALAVLADVQSAVHRVVVGRAEFGGIIDHEDGMVRVHGGVPLENHYSERGRGAC